VLDPDLVVTVSSLRREFWVCPPSSFAILNTIVDTIVDIMLDIILDTKK